MCVGTSLPAYPKSDVIRPAGSMLARIMSYLLTGKAYVRAMVQYIASLRIPHISGRLGV